MYVVLTYTYTYTYTDTDSKTGTDAYKNSCTTSARRTIDSERIGMVTATQDAFECLTCVFHTQDLANKNAHLSRARKNKNKTKVSIVRFR